VGDIISGEGLRPFWSRLLGPGYQPLKGIFWLKILLETMLLNPNLLSLWLAF